MEPRLGQEPFRPILVRPMTLWQTCLAPAVVPCRCFGSEEVALEREGLISLPSARPVAELLDRLETALAAKGITIFARIDHASGAAAG